jgi:hypothetical protein
MLVCKCKKKEDEEDGLCLFYYLIDYPLHILGEMSTSVTPESMEINNLPSTSSHIANPCDPPQKEEVKIVGMQINLFRNLDIKKKVINTTAIK